DVANTHLASDSAADGVAQTHRLLVLLAANTIVAGDLNDEPDSEVVQLLARAGWRDTWAEVSRDDGATAWAEGAWASRPSERLDYVLVPPAVRVISATVASSDFAGYGRLSDHLPLAV